MYSLFANDGFELQNFHFHQKSKHWLISSIQSVELLPVREQDYPGSEDIRQKLRNLMELISISIRKKKHHERKGYQFN